MLEITEIVDNPDGSATMRVNMSEDTMNMLIEYAINNILREKIKELEFDGFDDFMDDDLEHDDLEREEDITIETHVGP